MDIKQFLKNHTKYKATHMKANILGGFEYDTGYHQAIDDMLLYLMNVDSIKSPFDKNTLKEARKVMFNLLRE